MQDRTYMKLCAQLASMRSISLASARREIELLSLKESKKDLNTRKQIAARLIEETKSSLKAGGQSIADNFDQLLKASDQDENFMLED